MWYINACLINSKPPNVTIFFIIDIFYIIIFLIFFADSKSENRCKPPEFPLVPASRGFCLTLAGLLENFLAKIKSIDLKENTTAAAKTPKTECDTAI